MLARRLALSLAVAASAGCTVFSGWSDLQNGARSDGDAGGAAPAVDGGADSASTGSDSGADAAPPADDASAGIDAASVLMTVACGSTRCPLGEGCCAGIVGQGSTCASGSSACAPPHAYETCSDSSQCEVTLGHAAQCCDESSISELPGVSCRTSCAGVGQIVCDPTLLTPGCPSGTTCELDEAFGYDTCQ